jgi:hypothetical protein
MGLEGGFPFVTFTDLDQRIDMLEVNLGVDPCLFWALEEAGDLGKGILVFSCDFIKTSEVDAELESTVLLPAETYQSSMWR